MPAVRRHLPDQDQRLRLAALVIETLPQRHALLKRCVRAVRLKIGS
jgi:hypothetical protein